MKLEGNIICQYNNTLCTPRKCKCNKVCTFIMNDAIILEIYTSISSWCSGTELEISNLWVISMAVAINGGFLADNSQYAAHWMDHILSFHVGQLNVYG